MILHLQPSNRLEFYLRRKKQFLEVSWIIKTVPQCKRSIADTEKQSSVINDVADEKSAMLVRSNMIDHPCVVQLLLSFTVRSMSLTICSTIGRT